jgi:hypothetical protein
MEISDQSKWDYLVPYKSIKRLLRKIHWPKTSTWLTYREQIGPYLKSLQMDPDQFIALAKAQDPQELADQLYDHADTLTNGSKAVFKNAIWALLRHGGNISMPTLENDYEVENPTRSYTTDEIHRILGLLDNDLHKLLIYIAKDTGFRIRTILKLTYNHFKDDLEAEKDFVRVNLPREFYSQSNKSASLTFIGPETIEQFKLCLQPHQKEITKILEEIDPETKKQKKVKVIETFIPIVKEEPDEPIFKMRYSAAYDLISIALRKANINDENMNPYRSFRMFYTNAFRLPGVNEYEIDALTGHHANAIILKSYFEKIGTDSIEKLREIYQRAYPSLRVNVDKTTIQTQQTQEQKIKDLEKQVAELKGYYDNVLSQISKNPPLNAKEIAQTRSQPTDYDKVNEGFKILEEKGSIPPTLRPQLMQMFQMLSPELMTKVTKEGFTEKELTPKDWQELLKIQAKAMTTT